ncbi:hypothetical protein E0H82_06905 [Acinetobacter sp. ANC 4910]|uniref:hypothetical protein n=1 Tax=Acinetobacter sp. ANC 4910 TaxID=2529850 RepID=UPI00103CE73D|nr:hypothetical protein [Acinetobacter sp. ANC 4910]TCB35710.1 hypothetical protein E0H82_06905 [Acinetobacter sp. ANC 4910]
MLEFWYSERCSREIKLLSSIVVCSAIYFCSSIAQLAPLWVGLSLILGVLIHVLFTQYLKLATSHPYRITLRNGIYIFQLFALLSLAYILPEQHKWVLWLQCIGFHALGLFLVSIYSNRAKRHA